jgi:hypothetical protein
MAKRTETELSPAPPAPEAPELPSGFVSPPAPNPALSAEPIPPTVAEWTKALGVRRSIVAGAAYLAGWRQDTRLTREAFEAGVAKYAATPMGG